MTDNGNVGKALVPTKFGIKQQNPEEISPVTRPDRFGQVYDNQKDHTDGSGPSNAQSVNDHQSSDVDAHQRSQHHTLGTSRNQASPGNHIHDGITSPKLGLLKMDPAGNVTVPQDTLTGAKGGNVALANLITLLQKYINFTDGTT